MGSSIDLSPPASGSPSAASPTGGRCAPARSATLRRRAARRSAADCRGCRSPAAALALALCAEAWAMSSKYLMSPRRVASSVCRACRRASASRALSSAPGIARCPRIVPVWAARAFVAAAALAPPASPARPGASPRPRIAARCPPSPASPASPPAPRSPAAEEVPSVARAPAPPPRTEAKPDDEDGPFSSTSAGCSIVAAPVPPPHPKCGRYSHVGGCIQMGEPQVCGGCCLRRLAGRGEPASSRCARRSRGRSAGRSTCAGVSPPSVPVHWPWYCRSRSS